MMVNMILTALFITIFAGIANAGYLYWQYRQYKLTVRPMVCPLDGKCEEVVGTVYGTTFGVKNEIWGFVYYLSLLGLIGVYLFSVSFVDVAKFLIIFSSAGAVIFSTYLLWVQLITLQKYCSWCILATLINYLIFVLEIAYLF
ncbi:MAG: hypothetical protein HYW91_01405 [Candidatus Sungbacteria bacterium]|nr:hypothetical protein [Candidatus Sungbacteria bacterium]